MRSARALTRKYFGVGRESDSKSLINSNLLFAFLIAWLGETVILELISLMHSESLALSLVVCGMITSTDSFAQIRFISPAYSSDSGGGTTWNASTQNLPTAPFFMSTPTSLIFLFSDSLPFLRA